MKKFTDKVFSIVRQLRAAGKIICDDEVKGVLQLGVGRDLYAIQIDNKWTTDDEDYSSIQIAHELNGGLRLIIEDFAGVDFRTSSDIMILNKNNF